MKYAALAVMVVVGLFAGVTADPVPALPSTAPMPTPNCAEILATINDCGAIMTQVTQTITQVTVLLGTPGLTPDMVQTATAQLTDVQEQITVVQTQVTKISGQLQVFVAHPGDADVTAVFVEIDLTLRLTMTSFQGQVDTLIYTFNKLPVALNLAISTAQITGNVPLATQLFKLNVVVGYLSFKALGASVTRLFTFMLSPNPSVEPKFNMTLIVDVQVGQTIIVPMFESTDPNAGFFITDLEAISSFFGEFVIHTETFDGEGETITLDLQETTLGVQYCGIVVSIPPKPFKKAWATIKNTKKFFWTKAVIAYVVF